MRVYSLTIRNRAAALALTLVILGAGAALLVVGLALFAALAVAGGVLGAGLLAYRALRGAPRDAVHVRDRSARGLDPALEVFPEHRTIDRPGDRLPDNDPSRSKSE